MNYKNSPLAVVAILAAVTACTDVNTQTTNPNQRTQEGAGVGALTGALVGIMAGDDKEDRIRGAVAGGLIGAAAGSAIGYSLDKQAAELQAEFNDQRIQIIKSGDVLIVRMPQDILFAIDSAKLQAELRADLRVLAKNLQRYPDSTIQITGHTDNTGAASYNRDLSARRANSVAKVLVSKGVSGSRIRTIGAGEDNPIATNQTEQGRAQNRRVDVVIRPNN